MLVWGLGRGVLVRGDLGIGVRGRGFSSVQVQWPGPKPNALCYVPTTTTKLSDEA